MIIFKGAILVRLFSAAAAILSSRGIAPAIRILTTAGQI
jgi:hypothetical protein